MQKQIEFAKRYAFAAGAAAYTFTAGVRSPRHRKLIADIASHFGYRTGPETPLEQVEIGAITNSATAVVIPEPDGVDGNVSLLELLVLGRLAREAQPHSVFEIGTFDGRTTLTLAANTPEDARVRTLDLPPTIEPALPIVSGERLFIDKPSSGARVRGHALAGKIEQLYGDSAVFEFSEYPSEFIFVDGSHSYDYVVSDSRRARAMVPATGGTIVWHDYGVWEGVTRALNELARGNPAFAGLRWVRGTSLAILRV